MLYDSPMAGEAAPACLNFFIIGGKILLSAGIVETAYSVQLKLFSHFSPLPPCFTQNCGNIGMVMKSFR